MIYYKQTISDLRLKRLKPKLFGFDTRKVTKIGKLFKVGKGAVIFIGRY